jgi:transcription elongation factor Elf1
VAHAPLERESSPTPRAQPFYCPFCGEEDFVPFGEEPNRFLCNSCNRHYLVRFIGIDAGRREDPDAV